MAEINGETELKISWFKEEKDGARVRFIWFKVQTNSMPLSTDQVNRKDELVTKYKFSAWQAENVVRELTDRDIRTVLWQMQQKQEKINNIPSYLWTSYVNLGVTKVKKYL